MKRHNIQIKRAYVPATKNDGYRVLVDRLWPRGLKKSDVLIQAWMKELAPSSQLRKEFGHDPERWDEFQTRYKRELESSEARQMLDELADLAKKGTLTIVYSARDEEHNNAVVLKQLLEEKIHRR